VLLRIGALSFDTVARTATLRDIPLTLGRRELGVLEQLMRAAGRVVPRAVLEEAIYTIDDEVTPNALDAAVSRLRRALNVTGVTPPALVTVRGVGWMLARESTA
jgi:two-component system OmpR family response regulator